MSGYAKLWNMILSSSIWNEDDKTRIVWITILAMKDKNGFVSASVGGLAHQARVSIEDCQKALNKLMSPDSDSRTIEDDGRRIQKKDGGFYVLNHEKYRDARNDDERKDYMRNYMREKRSKENTSNENLTPINNVNNIVNNVSTLLTPVNSSKLLLAHTDTDTNINTCAKKKKFDYKNESFNEFWKSYPKKKGKWNALKCWNSIEDVELLLPKMIRVIEYYKTTNEWKRDAGQWIPLPTSWLNSGGWDDEIKSCNELSIWGLDK